MILKSILATQLMLPIALAQTSVFEEEPGQDIALPVVEAEQLDGEIDNTVQEEADAFLESIKVEDLLNQARNALNADQFPEAAAAYAVAADRIPSDERLQYNLGVAAYRAGDLETSARAFELSADSDDPDLTSASLFNRGNVAYRTALETLEAAQEAQREEAASGQVDPATLDAPIQALDEAIGRYRDAIGTSATNRDARRNAELAHRLKKALEEQQQQQEQQQQDQQQQDQQQDQQQAMEQIQDQKKQLQDMMEQMKQNEDQLTDQQKQQMEQIQNAIDQLEELEKQLQEQMEESTDSEEDPEEQQEEESRQDQLDELKEQLEELRSQEQQVEKMLEQLPQEDSRTPEQQKQAEQLEDMLERLDQIEQELLEKMNELMGQDGNQESSESEDNAQEAQIDSADEGMTREEAKRLLQRVRDREKARREAREEAASRGPASTGKDW